MNVSNCITFPHLTAERLINVILAVCDVHINSLGPVYDFYAFHLGQVISTVLGLFSSEEVWVLEQGSDSPNTNRKCFYIFFNLFSLNFLVYCNILIKQVYKIRIN